MWGRWRHTYNLASDFVWAVSCVKAGIPTLLIAPTSGGKTTIVYAVDKYLKMKEEPHLLISRIGLRGLRKIADIISMSGNFTLLNEDYALIGSSDYMVEKMAEIIGALSYSRTYYDYGLDITITVDRLGFVSGVQPWWIKTMMTKPAFITHIREKFIRYYLLPYKRGKDVDMLTAIEDLVNTLLKVEDEPKETTGFRIPREFIEALSVQVGMVRATEYAERIAYPLAELIGAKNVHRALRFYAKRIEFEDNIVRRDLDERGYNVDVLWQEYTALYWCLRKGVLSREAMRRCLGVSSMRSVERVIDKGIRVGWITSIWNCGRKYFIANPRIREELGW